MKKPLISIIALLSYTLSFGQLPAWLPTANNVLWIPFTGNTNDSSGRGNNGTATAVTFTTDRLGNPNSAGRFNGTTSNILIPSTKTDLNIIGSVTIAAWVKFDPVNAGLTERQILWHGDMAMAEDPYALTAVRGTYSFRRDTALISDSVSSPYIDSNFHHVVGTFDSVTKRYSLYVDGNLVHTRIIPGTITYATATHWTVIGAVGSGNNNENLNGVIDQVALYKRALSICEVQRLYLENNSIATAVIPNQTVAPGANATFHESVSFAGVNYQWQANLGSGFADLSNSSTYSGVTTNTLTVNNVTSMMNNVQFRCRIYLTGGCTDTSTIATLLVRTDDVKHVSAASEINISPVPSANSITVSIPSSLIGKQFIVTDISGKELLKGRLETNKNNVSISGLANGMYFLKVEGVSCVNKILKN